MSCRRGIVDELSAHRDRMSLHDDMNRTLGDSHRTFRCQGCGTWVRRVDHTRCFLRLHLLQARATRDFREEALVGLMPDGSQ
jgi:hypothetical protein